MSVPDVIVAATVDELMRRKSRLGWSFPRKTWLVSANILRERVARVEFWNVWPNGKVASTGPLPLN